MHYMVCMYVCNKCLLNLVYEVNGSIHGHHIIKEIWTLLFIGEDLECRREMNQIPEMCMQ